jgi:hypothetical protein
MPAALAGHRSLATENIETTKFLSLEESQPTLNETPVKLKSMLRYVAARSSDTI